jgi:hypothetical protein
MDIGLRLAGLFAAAGIASPELACETMMWGPADPEPAEWITATLASLAPVLRAKGIAGPDDLDDGGRLAAIRHQAPRFDSQLLGLMSVAAWATRQPA